MVLGHSACFSLLGSITPSHLAFVPTFFDALSFCVGYVLSTLAGATKGGKTSRLEQVVDW